MREHWNERYAQQEFIYGKAPNEFLKTYLEAECPGKILFPCEGEGRNAVFAAVKGWDVHAVDFSETAQKKAMNWAKSNHVNIRYDIQDVNEWNTDIQFDCIALIYAHFPPQQRTQLHQKFVSLLKPAGKIILESFSKKQIHYDSGGPDNPELLYDESILGHDFHELQIEFLQERVIELNEGMFHKGDASIIRMIAIKKQPGKQISKFS